MTRAAWAVVDLGFGDAGKGTTTDYLVRAHDARLVVRFNGGAQAGHTVVLADGRHHTFAQLGAGTFVAGVGTHLGPAFALDPGALRVEARALAGLGVTDALARTTIDRRARVITPFHRAACRIRERARGDDAHGTTGVGVGEAVSDALAGHDDVFVAWREGWLTYSTGPCIPERGPGELFLGGASGTSAPALWEL
ncbi:MAG: adenylosuccinate synthetase, partial [Myxococcota bacterium]